MLFIIFLNNDSNSSFQITAGFSITSKKEIKLDKSAVLCPFLIA